MDLKEPQMYLADRRTAFADASNRANSFGSPAEPTNATHLADATVIKGTARKKWAEALESARDALSPRCSPSLPRRNLVHDIGKAGSNDNSLAHQDLDSAMVAWLNAVLSPEGETGVIEGAEKREAYLTRRLWELVNCDKQVQAIKAKVKQQIAKKRIVMAPGVAAKRNAAARKSMTKAMGSYHPLWLRLGLQAVLSAPTRDLPDLTDEFFLQTECEGLNGKAQQSQRSAALLERVLILGLILDTAAIELASEGSLSPPLFSKSAKHRSSHEIMFAMLHSNMLGEGDVMRELAFLGYRLKHQQHAVVSFDWTVNSAATDLRDGLRLCKLAEVLSGNPTICATAKFNVGTRVSCVFNVRHAFKAFSKAGLNFKEVETPNGAISIDIEDIVDGDEERTLALLCACAKTLQVPRLLDLEALRLETDRLLLYSKREVAKGQNIISQKKLGQNPSQASVEAAILLRWVQAVLSVGDDWAEPISGLRHCFEEGGRALCAVVQYYEPGLVNLESLASFPWARDETGHTAHGAFSALNEVVAALGSIPDLLRYQEPQRVDERVMELFLAFLCARLLEATAKERKAQRIQRAWRCWQAKQPGFAIATLHRWEAAAASVQAVARPWLARRAANQAAQKARRRAEVDEQIRVAGLNMAVTRIAAHWRGASQRRRFHKNQSDVASRRHMEVAATRIAAAWKMAVRRKVYVRNQQAVTCIAATWRMYILKASFMRQKAAATAIAAAFRMRVGRAEYMRQRTASTAIATAWKAHVQRAMFMRQRAAATAIASAWRMSVQREEYMRQRAASTAIASAWRMSLQREEYMKKKAAVTATASAWRMRVQRIKFMRQRAASTAIASAWRMSVQRDKYLRQRAAATAIASAWRMFVQREGYLRQRAASTAIASAWRMSLQREEYLRQRAASIAIASAWRMSVQREEYLGQRAASTAIASAWRMSVQREEYMRQRAASTAIASAWRMSLQREEYMRQRAASTAIASAWRMSLQREEYMRQRAAVTAIASAWRMSVQREKYMRQRAASTAIASAWRMSVQREGYLRQRAAVTAIASAWRMSVQREEYLGQRAAATAIAAVWKMFVQRKGIKRQITAAISISAAWRMSKRRQDFLRLKASATIIASAWRLRVKSLSQATTVISAYWKGKAQRRRFRALRRHARLKLAKEEEAHAAQARQSFKAAVRELRATAMEYTRRFKSAIIIQAAWRGHAVRKHARLLMMAVQGDRPLAKASSAVVPFDTPEMERLGAAIYIQALWRGHVERRARRAAVKEIAARLNDATAKAGARRSIGTKLKVKLFELSQLPVGSLAFRDAARGLLRYAEVSKECCNIIMSGGFVPRILEAMQDSARSHNQAVRPGESRHGRNRASPPANAPRSGQHPAEPLLALLAAVSMRPGRLAAEVVEAAPQSLGVVVELLQALRWSGYGLEAQFLACRLYRALAVTLRTPEAVALASESRAAAWSLAQRIDSKAEGELNLLEDIRQSGWGSSEALQAESARRLLLSAACLKELVGGLLPQHGLQGDCSAQDLVHSLPMVQYVNNLSSNRDHDTHLGLAKCPWDVRASLLKPLP